jgi:tungstate transport system ATP-binding protein
MLFEIRNLTKVYGDRTVLDVPELGIERGKVHGLLGPNGSGKTTLLEILSFLLAPTTGDIVYDSRTVSFFDSPLQNLRREVSMVDQQPILFSTTVYKNVEFGLKIRKISRSQRKKIVHEVLELVGMRDFAEALAHKLSGGETQRVAIARALACSPRAILFDEPTSNVDIENQVIIERIMRDINAQKGISVIFTTHNRMQATKLSDHLVFLFKGRPTSSIHENLFSGLITRDDQGKTYCSIYDKLHFNVQTEKTGHVKVSFEPRGIRILPLESEPGPQESKGLAGQVVQLTDEGDDVRALVEVGIPISVLLARTAYEKSPILAGQRVLVVFPPESIEIM